MRKKKNNAKVAIYHISDVSRKFNLHPQTLRLYEREGLLKPSRSQGNTRLYSDKDLKELEVILSLIRDLGVNLAGVEVILNMRRRMDQVEADVNAFLEYIREHYFQGKEAEFDQKRFSLVHLQETGVVKVEEKG
jgi:MerR family transcriptional regulator/heat shock protein HspR